MVAKLKLTPDAHGRIVGNYDFTAADPLDDYDVTCLGGIVGKASVKLAEFRKSKVRLDVSGKRESDQFKLHFKTLDFLGKPVPATSLRFSAKISRKSAPRLNLWGLSPEAYHGYQKDQSPWYVMDAEQRALLEAGNIHVQSLIKSSVLHHFSKVLEIGKDGQASHTLALDPLWKDDCLIEITATVVDANNREQHVVKKISLSTKTVPDFEFALGQSEAIAGRALKLLATQKQDSKQAIQAMSFVVFELQTAAKSLIQAQNTPNIFLQNSRFPTSNDILGNPLHLDPRFRRARLYVSPYTPQKLEYELQRKFIAMQVGKQANKGSWESKLTLTRPGAYVIRAVGIGANGIQQESERTLVIKPQQSVSALQLDLDHQQLENGKALSGNIHSSFTNAKVLLVVRDAHGVLEITIAPSIAGDMLDSLDYLIDYPHGCVEQTMSRFLPVVKVAQILKENEIDDPALAKKVPRYAEAGIKRLLELQQKDGGWGWQGSGATHEMMTPYALYGLIEAQKAGFKIPNEKAIERGMVRLEKFIDHMSTRQAADRIYCMWVYSQHKPLKEKWWKWLHQLSRKTLTTKKVRIDLLSDYAAALTLEMATNAKKTQQKSLADQMMRLLSYRAKYNQSKTQTHWTTSGFSRWGNDRFEITAAVLKAIVAYDSEHPLVAKSLNYFAATKRGNRWNSTKDTAMILYAMCDYLSKQNINLNDSATETKLTINGKELVITNPSWKPKKVIISGKTLTGKSLQVEFTKGDKSHQYRMVFRYWKQGRDVSAVHKGIHIVRTIELIDTHGKSIRVLKSGDTVPSGSFIRSTIRSSFNQRADFALLVDPKISAAEYTNIPSPRMRHPRYVLREDKAVGTFWHYELAQRRMNNTSTYRVEMEGTFLIAPAYAELMYDTAVRGNSDSFMLIVKEK